MSFLPKTAAFKKHQSLPLGKLWIVLVSVTSSQNRWKIYSFEDSQSTTQTHMNQATNLKRKKQINKVDRSGVVKCLELHGSAWSAHFNLSTWHCMLLWDNLNMTHYRLRLHITTSQVLRFKPREYCLQGLGKLLMTLNYASWVLSYVGTTCSFSSKHALTNSLISLYSFTMKLFVQPHLPGDVAGELLFLLKRLLNICSCWTFLKRSNSRHCTLFRFNKNF